MPGKDNMMSFAHNVEAATGVYGGYHDSPLGKKEPLNHPKNCKHECCYGFNRAFCWPCMKKIMEEHNAAKKVTPQEG